MTTFGISTSPQGTSYAALRDLWREADDSGLFTTGWVNDHYAAFVGPPWRPDLDQGCADGWTVLPALLHDTTTIRGGVLVSGVHFRSAAKLAHMAATLGWSTGGRVDLGLGAGWSPEECDAFGVPLGDPKTRVDRFAEALPAIIALLDGQTVTVSGDHVQLAGARITVRGPSMPPVCIGGLGERRMLPLVARYADHWSYEGADHAEFRHKLDVVQRCCVEIGRDPAEIDASMKVRFAPDEPADVVAERAQACIDAGATIVLVSFPRPLDASMVGPIVEVLGAL